MGAGCVETCPLEDLKVDRKARPTQGFYENLSILPLLKLVVKISNLKI